MLKLRKWIRFTAIGTFIIWKLTPVVSAEKTRTIEDESIYDLLVDRYFNATNENDDISKYRSKKSNKICWWGF